MWPVKGNTPPLPEKSYDVVLADPPWDYYGDATKMGAAGKHYNLMSDEELLAFPMKSLLNKNGVLFMWVTSPRLDFALECLKAWGLHYRGVSFVWVKTKRDGTPIGAQGVRPSIVKPLTEFVIAASPVKKGRPMKLGSESVVQTILAPKGEHSVKPDDVHERIELLYPDASRIELFARRSRPSWDLWGNQAPDPANEHPAAESHDD